MYESMKIPPHSIDAEQSVLGGLLLRNAAYDEVQGIINSDDFYRKDHRLLFAAIRDLASKQQPFDVVTLPAYLEGQGHISEDFGGLAYLGTLAKDTPTSANVIHYANIVRDASLKRKLIEAAAKAMEQAYMPDSGDAKSLIHSFEADVYRLSEGTIKSRESLRHVKPILKETLVQMQEQASNPHDGLLGSSTGIGSLDQAMDGLVDSDLIIVAGRPSMGKTTLAMNMASSVAETKPVAVFSLEMSAVSLGYRLISSAGKISLKKVRASQRLVQDDWPKVANGVQILSDRHLYVDDQEGLTVSDIRARCRRLRRELEAKHPEGLGLVVIDYLSMIRPVKAAANRNLEIEEITRNLKGLAKELNCPVVLLSQLNRSLENRPNKRPVMSDLRESGAIEQDADVILFVYRDEVYNPETPDKGKAEIIIGKYRNGQIGTVNTVFRGEFCRFDDYASDYEGYGYA